MERRNTRVRASGGSPLPLAEGVHELDESCGLLQFEVDLGG